jgi:hypothetical protein
MSIHHAEEKGDSFSVVQAQSDIIIIIIIIIIIEKRALEQTQQQREQILRRNLPRSNQTKSNAFNFSTNKPNQTPLDAFPLS